MTSKAIEQTVVGQYIDSNRSNLVKVVTKDGSISFGEFIKLLQEDGDIESNKWFYSSMGLEMLLDGDDIESITPT
jgi:hypothetical protein